MTEATGIMQASPQLKADLLGAIPNLRAFAVSLCGNPDRADDLVQETLVKAWSNLGSFVEGTNMPAWLFTILRNIYYSEYRKRRREVSDSEGTIAARLATAPAQNGHMDFLDFREALQKLPADQREALVLIGASGMSYEEAAGICNCAVGTMKSRVNRARNRLIELLSIGSSSDFSSDANWQTGLDTLIMGHRFSLTGRD
ncbi:MAG: polymerase sigma factor [Hyphomicrobiales bacterium]|nr:polymerase sigma factor [Hyphomicrobiales bacterium]